MGYSSPEETAKEAPGVNSPSFAQACAWIEVKENKIPNAMKNIFVLIFFEIC
jgi:hypothetical protein